MNEFLRAQHKTLVRYWNIVQDTETNDMSGFKRETVFQYGDEKRLVKMLNGDIQSIKNILK